MDLSDVERDAAQAAETLTDLRNRLPVAEQVLVDEAGAAAQRVLAYLRSLRGAGDGAATAVAPRLGPWREWCPPRGHLLGDTATRVPPRPHLRARRHGDPGE
jgi:hypothetical protein